MDKSQINTTINDVLNECFNRDNRAAFLSLIGRVSNLSAYNLALVYNQYKEAQFLAGAGEWYKSGRKIKSECKGQEITVLLPVLKDISTDNQSKLEYELIPFFVYDVSQTVPDKYEDVLTCPNIIARFKEETNYSIMYTDDKSLLGGRLSNVQELSTGGKVLYLSDISEEMQDIEVLRAYIEYCCNVKCGNHFCNDYESVVKAALFSVTSYFFEHVKHGISLLFLDSVERYSRQEKLDFISDVVHLTFNVINGLSGMYYFDFDSVMVIRELKQVLSMNEKDANSINYVRDSLKNSLISVKPTEFTRYLERQVKDIAKITELLNNDDAISFISMIESSSISNYPRTEYKIVNNHIIFSK